MTIDLSTDQFLQEFTRPQLTHEFHIGEHRDEWYKSVTTVPFSKEIRSFTYQNIKLEACTLSVPDQIKQIADDLNLSKTSLAEIFGVSRQTIYDWISSKNEGMKPENLAKLEWLVSLSGDLGENVRTRLWLWKNKRLSSGMMLGETINKASVDPSKLAIEINATLAKWQNVGTNIAENNNKPNRDYSGDQSVPFDEDV